MKFPSLPKQFLLLSFLINAQCAYASPAIVEFAGLVQVQRVGDPAWQDVVKSPHPLSPGDQIRTRSHAKTVILFEDGSKVELGGDSLFTLEDATGGRSAMRLNLGRLRAWVQKLISRSFEVRTSMAVCSVRGTEFEVSVLSGGQTLVSLYKGLLGVTDNQGQEKLLNPNERLRIDASGMALEKLATQSQTQNENFHASMKRELGLDMSKEEVLAAAAREIKLAEYQQGKALIDVSGNRVRLEEYILRPQSDQFKFVVLNERENRFDYFYYLGTFNKQLPTDLSVALRQLPGAPDTPPEFYLTRFETGRSNTVDSMRELASGGHLVDVNNNSDTSDNVGSYYDSLTDSFQSVASGRSFYQSLFDNYGFYINGKIKHGWTGSNIQSYGEANVSLLNDPISGALLTSANAWLDSSGFLPARSLSTTFPDSSLLHQRIYESYSDGSFTQWDNYIIDDEGRVAPVSAFAGITSGAGYKSRLLDFNYEQVITSTHFNGRKIDLVVEPKIFIQSGLVQ